MGLSRMRGYLTVAQLFWADIKRVEWRSYLTTTRQLVEQDDFLAAFQ
jgi:hypothetical protein